MGEGDSYATDHGNGTGKGKGKAPNTSSELRNEERGLVHPGENPSTDVSTTSRIVNSAAALARSLVSNPSNANDVGQVFPTNKAEPSSSNSKPSRADASSYSTQPVPTSSGNSFRSAHVMNHITQEEAAFSEFLDGTGVVEPTVFAPINQSFTGYGPDYIPRQSHMSETEEYSNTDGMDVVKLLDSGYDEVALGEPDTPLSREEEVALKRSIFGETGSREQTARQTSWDNILNFFPEFISNGSSGWGYNEISQHLGTLDVTEAREIWVDQWKNVLSSYTDEVWGDLSSLVEEAREEIQQLSTSPPEGTPSELKALQRLRQLLAHVRGNTHSSQ